MAAAAAAAAASYSPLSWSYLPRAQHGQQDEIEDATNGVRSTDQETRQQHQQLKEHQQRLASQIRVGISLDSTTNLEELQGQIKGMLALEKMDIYVEDSFKRHLGYCNAISAKEGVSLEEDSLARLTETIASLPKLQWLRIRSSSIAVTSRGVCSALPFSVLATLVKRCPSLKYLLLNHIDFVGIPGSCKNKNEACCWVEGLALLLEDNTKIEELRIDHRFRKVSQQGQQSLLKMLQYHNFTLECLELDKPTLRHVSPDFKKNVAFWLAMNQKGLREALLSSTRTTRHEDWRDAIMNHRKKTSVIYYLLSNNPSMLVGMASA